MVPHQLKTRARRVIEEINQGDLAIATELISPDCVLYVPRGPSVSRLTALRDWLTVPLRIFPDFHALMEAEIADAAGTFSGRSR
jgi:SnoaL-like protein